MGLAYPNPSPNPNPHPNPNQVRRLRLWMAATSLGGVESLVEHRYSIEGAGEPRRVKAPAWAFGLGSADLHSRTPSGRARRLRMHGSKHPGRDPRLLGTQPRPRVLQRWLLILPPLTVLL